MVVDYYLTTIAEKIKYVKYVPVAQLDRALDSDSKGRWFESSRAYQSLPFLLAVGFAFCRFRSKKGTNFFA